MNQKLWDTGKAVLRGKFAVIQAYLRIENFQISNLTLQLKKLESEEQKPKPNKKHTLKKKKNSKNVSRKKEIIKIRGETNGSKGKKESVKL